MSDYFVIMSPFLVIGALMCWSLIDGLGRCNGCGRQGCDCASGW